MTLTELTTALWEARVVLSLKPDGSPAAKGTVTPEIRAALAEHRVAIIDLLRGLHGAVLEGLECGACFPEVVPKDKVEAERMKLRHCQVHHWATAHYPRRA